MARFSALAVLALVGCVDDAPLETETAQAALACPKWGCGENSPVIGPWDFHELNTNGLENFEHIRIIDFELGGQSYDPAIVNGHQLIATPTSGSGPTLSGSALAGGWFNIQTPGGAYRIIIANVQPLASSITTFWVGAPSQIETYELTYTGPGITQGRVCNNAPERDSGEGSGRIWQKRLDAIFFTGDRYDSTRKDVTHTSLRSTYGWFNIACAGSALAKLHLNRHTTVGTASGFTTGWAERQALLKMYVSDVCGTGSEWTEAGTKLHWENPGKWNSLNGVETSFEARWNEHGAICMDTHRLGLLYANPAGFHAECVPPPCNGSVSAPAFGGALFVSANP